MKKHFFCYCLVSLFAALVFSSCDQSDFEQPIAGTLNVSPSSGEVGTTFYARYAGGDGNKIDEIKWRYEDDTYTFSAGPLDRTNYEASVIATRAGTLRAYAVVSRLGYNGISSGLITVYNKPVPPPVERTEIEEVASTGQLTITGLENYNDWRIEGNAGTNIYACETAYNTNKYLDGILSAVSKRTEIPGRIFDGQVTLKLFIIIKDYSFGTYYEGYTDNWQDVKFEISINSSTKSAHGTVTASFTNGVGSGVFVPDPPAAP